MQRFLTLCSLTFLWIASSVAAAEKPEREKPALDALNAMGQYLRDLKSFEVQVNSNTDKVLDNGQLLQFYHATTLVVDRPSRLYVTVSSAIPGAHKTFFYNGQEATLYSEPSRFYTTFKKVPPILEQLSTTLNSEYGIELPLADLFDWGTERAPLSNITSALVIGEEQLAGQVCQHYAYRQKDVDWQLWIATGDKPLPCKIVIVDHVLKAQPQHTAVYQWNLSPDTDVKRFTFTPPADAKPIAIKSGPSASAR